MKKKNVLLLLLIITMSSCEVVYNGEWRYYVENGLESDTVTIITHREYTYSGLYLYEIKDSVFVLLPKERKLIHTEAAGNYASKLEPNDVMAYQDSELGRYELGQIEVFINNVKLEKSLWERKYWEYTTKELEGTYLLVINERTINEDN
jgi:hypothetical protein